MPPDNPFLCQYPEIYANLSENSANTILEHSADWYPSPVALFVNVNNCTAERKAEVAVEIKQKLMSQLELLVIYSPNAERNDLVTLYPDSPDSMDSYRSIGLVYIPFSYAAGLSTRLRLNIATADPRLLIRNNINWTFPIQLDNYTVRADSGDDKTGGGFSGRGKGGGDRGDRGDIYWFRIILFSLLVLSPCCRACYLWYAGGGRFYFRRHENGRIIGLQYVPPTSTWLNARLGGNQGASGEARSPDILTEEQFQTLPEIKFEPIVSHYDEDCEEEEDNGGVFVAEGNSQVEMTDLSRNNETKSSVVAESKVSNGNNGREMAIQVGRGDDDMIDIEEGEVKASDDAPDDTTKPSDYEARIDEQVDLSSREQDAEVEGMELGTSANIAAEENTDRTVDTKESATNEPLLCRSTMCSICIDEFEPGEKIILLPRCQHGFHRDCIHPWLTQRQGCCPFCKTTVFAAPDEEAAASEGITETTSEDGNLNSSDSPSSGEAERTESDNAAGTTDSSGNGAAPSSEASQETNNNRNSIQTSDPQGQEQWQSEEEQQRQLPQQHVSEVSL